MKIPTDINQSLEKIYKETSPVSMFLYGSQSRGDVSPKSDYEVGVIYKKGEKISRLELLKMHSVENLNTYPFIYEDILQNKIDTPFPIAIYLRSLFDGGAQTLYGEAIVERSSPPQILSSDTLEEITFQIAYAVGSLLSFRQGDLVTAKDQFIKATLFGSRALLILEQRRLVLRYDEIVKSVSTLNIKEEHKKLVNKAEEMRQNNENIQLDDIFESIKFLSQDVRKSIKNDFLIENKILIEGIKLT